MPKGSIKIKKVIDKEAMSDTNVLNEMFEQMTGSQNADLDIIIPKLLNLNTQLIKFVKVYNMLLKFSDFIDNFSEYKDEFINIESFINTIDSIRIPNMTEDKLKNMDVTKVNDIYKTLKNKNEIQSIIVTSSNLKHYKKYLENINSLKDDFINREPGLYLKPLAFSNLDIKILWTSDKLSVMAKKYILSILSHTYTIGIAIYDIVSSPDIDVKKFSKILIDSIDRLKKQIPRCDKAFNIIRNSVELLENNFKGYYKNSVESDNPSIIIESFIVDVSMSQKSNASTISQFRKIIMYMKKIGSNNKDPRVVKLFNILNKNLSMMEKNKSDNPDDNSGDNPENEDNPEDNPENDDNPEDNQEDVDDKTDGLESLDLENILNGLMENINSDNKD